VPDSETSCASLPAGQLLLGCQVKRTRSRGVQPSTDYRGTRTLDVPVRGLNEMGCGDYGRRKSGSGLCIKVAFGSRMRWLPGNGAYLPIVL
jgi:hypothetical protein